MSISINTRNMTRRFDNVVALDQLSLSVPSGQIFGLLGPNASGKSTTIRLLAGILRPDEGEASIMGLNLLTQTEELKQRIGYVAQHFALYSDLSVYENVSFYAGLYGIDNKPRLHELLDLYSLSQFKHKRAGLLSGGYQRRLAIVCATTHNPELIFLDEPTAGIDPVTRKELWDLFYALSTSGKTLFVTTHYMEEAERCNQLAFLNQGKLIAQGTPTQIRNSLADHQVYSVEIQHNPELTDRLLKLEGVELVNQFGQELRIITNQSASLDQLQELIDQYQAESIKVTVVSPSIEDAFMSLTSSGE